MKRTISVLAVLAVMAAMLVASAMPAFAAANPTANCVGQLASDLNRSPFFPPGGGGKEVSETAKAGATGELASFCAQ